MATIQKPLMQRVVRKRMTGALLVLALAGPSSVHATSSTQPPVVGPQVPPPQGILTVYSERYVMEDADVPVLYRRPVELYTSEGHLVGTYKIRLVTARFASQFLRDTIWSSAKVTGPRGRYR